MKTLVCEVNQCPYNKDGQCCKPLKVINKNGMCAFIYNDNGSIKSNWNKKEV